MDLGSPAATDPPREIADALRVIAWILACLGDNGKVFSRLGARPAQ